MFIIAAITRFEKFMESELYSSTILVAALMIIIKSLKQGNIREENLKAQVDSCNALMKETQQKLQDSVTFNKDLRLSASHEFRNPLNSIVGNLDLMQRKLAPEEPCQEHIKMAKIGCDTLLNSLNNMLDSCKAEFDEIDINYVSVNIRKTFEKIWGVCSEFLKRKGLQGELYFHVNVPPMLLVDTERLHQIILNLVHNSSKFTSKGFVKIIVSWHPSYDNNSDDTFTFGSNKRGPSQYNIANIKRPTTPERARLGSHDFSASLEEEFSEHPCPAQKITFSPSMNYNKLDLQIRKFPKMHKRTVPISSDEGLGFLKIQVIDSGVGIHPSNLPKLFQKFGKFTHDSMPRVEGSGLGLWVTKKICNKMEGSIHAYSDVGKGSTFLVFLKCQISPQSLGTPTPSPCMASRRDRSTLQTMGSMPFMTNKTKMESTVSLKEPQKEDEVKLSAMVVDDLPYNQQLNKQFLELCGVSVKQIAANGLEAYKKRTAQDKEQVDLIFMDLDMPIMDGKTSSIKIREWEKRHKVSPVIIVILTGNCSEDELKLCLDKTGPIKADYFYRKPLSLSDCQNLIRQIKREKVKKKPLSNNNFPRIASNVLIYEKDLFQQVLLENYLRVGQVKYYIANKTTLLEKFAKYCDTISVILYSCEDINKDLQDYKEFVCQIRGFLRKKGRKDIPILGIIKDGNREDMAKLREIGISDFLVKPFDYENTIKLIKSHSQNGLLI